MSSDVSSIYSQDNINSPKSNDGGIYEFENFRLDAAHLMLYKNEQPISLAPKVIETLLALVERRGEVVSKDEMMERLWADSFVEESNLTQNIYLLRKTLGKTADGQDLIETFRRRGYRFTGEIKFAAAKIFDAETDNQYNKTANIEDKFERQPPEQTETQNLEVEKDKSPTGKNKFLFSAAIFGLFILTLFGIVYFFAKTDDEKPQTISLKDTKFTRLTPDINAYNPAISPDGKYLAYALVENEKYSLWIKDLATGGTTEILPPASEILKAPQFSPDGKQIYFLTVKKDVPNHVIARLPLSGGEPEFVSGNVISPFTLSPDGKQIAFVREFDLIIAETNGSSERILAKRDGKQRLFESWDAQPSWSPDGKRIAVCGTNNEKAHGRAELLTISVDNGDEQEIPIPNWDFLSDTAWLSDGKSLLVTAKESVGLPYQIWQIEYPDGAAKKITNDINSYDWLSLSADSRMLVAQQIFNHYNLWSVSLDNSRRAKQMTFGAAALDGSSGIAVAPDGKIIFTSARSGNIDLWTMNADGGEQKQLTKNVGGWNGRPQLMPDGQFIVFSSSRSGISHIWRIDADGGDAQQLTFGDEETNFPSLSPDGATIYYTRGDGKAASIWKVSIDGGEPVLVSKFGWSPSPAPNGKLISFQFYDENSATPWKIGILNTENGEILKTFDNQVFRGLTVWTADSKAFIYIEGETANLRQQPINGNKTQPLTNFENGRISNFAFSSDYKQLVLSRGDFSTEAVLITNFKNE